MSIKTKLLSAIIIAIIFISFFAGVTISWQINQKLAEHANIDIKNNIDYTSKLVNFYFGRVQDSVNNLTNDPLMTEALTTKNPQKLQQVSDKFTTVTNTVSILETITLMEVNGSSCITRATIQAFLASVGKDYADRDYCKGIIKTKAPYLSSAYIGTVTKHPNLALVVPVKNPKGEMIGFISGVIDLSELRGYLWDLQRDSSMILLDRYGTPFLDTTQKIDKLDNPPTNLVSEIKKRLAENKKEEYFKDGNDFTGYKNNGSLTIVYKTPAANLLALTKTLNLITAFVSMMAMVLLTLVVYFFVGTVTKRITRLTKIAQDITSGQFSIKLDEEDLKASDETAVLARAFNEMATKLADLYKGLEEKVKQRTAELEEKTKKLEASEGEIKKALDASEQANKLMVGRELEMVKLKQRIKELEEVKT
jgi:C4-dicarboxylate-specific signal transduction histidine kinase